MTFNFNTEIVGYKSEKGRLTSLTDQYGKSWQADVFVINSDAAYFRGSVFKRRKFSDDNLKKMSWTMGYLTFYVGVKTKIPQVELHNYFLGDNYEQYAKDVMKNPGTMEKPYYYVNVVSRLNTGCAPEGCEALLFVWEIGRASCRERV